MRNNIWIRMDSHNTERNHMKMGFNNPKVQSHAVPKTKVRFIKATVGELLKQVLTTLLGFGSLLTSENRMKTDYRWLALPEHKLTHIVTPVEAVEVTPKSKMHFFPLIPAVLYFPSR